MALALAMISGLFAVVVAFVGIVGAIINEHYKAHKARAAVAAVFHAEISALTNLTATAGTAASFAKIAESFEAGTVFAFPQLYTPPPAYGPVFEQHVDRIGLLGAADAEDVALFYNYLKGVRTILPNLTSGVWQASPESSVTMAQQTRLGLGFWNQCDQITARLLPEGHR